MNYREIKSELQKIIEVTTSVPEQFQEKCFEILLVSFLEKSGHPTKAAVAEKNDAESSVQGVSETRGKIPLRTKVKVFMERNDISEKILRAVIMYEGGAVHFIRKPSPNTKAKGQIQWALLLALKSGIESDSFQVDPEALRSICQEEGLYDPANFAANFKQTANASLFKAALQPQGEPQPLSPKGDVELASLLRSLAEHHQ